MSKRRRFDHSKPLQDRLASFAKDLREKASLLLPGPAKDDLLRRARLADITFHLDDWANSAGLQPPK